MVLTASALVAICSAAWAETGTFRVLDLGTLGGDSSSAADIDELGRVVGTADTAEVDEYGLPLRHAFLWLPVGIDGMPPGINDLGTLGGDESQGYGIGPGLRVTGSAETPEPGAYSDISLAFLWQDGVLSGLGTGGGFPFSAGSAVNGRGEVGGAVTSALGCIPMLWLPVPDHGLPAGLSILQPLTDFIEGAINDLNSQSQAVGMATNACDAIGGEHAFLWLPEPAYGLAAGGHDLTPDLGPYDGGRGWAINEAGQVVGTIEVATSGRTDGFLWQQGLRTVLPALAETGATRPVDINDRGQIVGESGGRAALWQDLNVIDLNDLLPPDSGWTLRRASGINDRGQIVGDGTHNGQSRAFLLSPDGLIAEVPTLDPVGLIVITLLLASASLITLRRSRRPRKT